MISQDMIQTSLEDGGLDMQGLANKKKKKKKKKTTVNAD
jgi:hypothetical protein